MPLVTTQFIQTALWRAGYSESNLHSTSLLFFPLEERGSIYQACPIPAAYLSTPAIATTPACPFEQEGSFGGSAG